VLTGRFHLKAAVILLLAAGVASTHVRAEYLDWQRPCPALLPAHAAASCYCTPQKSLLCSPSVDVLVLTRSAPGRNNVLFAGAVTNPVLNAKDLGFDARAGVRVGLLADSPCGCDLQFTYMGLPRATVGESRQGAGLFYTFYGQPSPVGVNDFTAYYRSQFDSIQLSIRSRQWERIAPVAGLRFTYLDEKFDIVETANPNSSVSSSVTNHLYGVQFGAQGLIWDWGPTRIETTALGGFAINDVAVGAAATSAAGAVQYLDRRFSHMAFTGEILASWVYQVSPCAAVRLGYQALWLEGVGLAPDQVDNFRAATNEGSLDISGTFYQGGYVGFELTL
jgi:hypothetical protein